VAFERIGDRRAPAGDLALEREVHVVDAGLGVVQPVQPRFGAELHGVRPANLRQVAVEVGVVFSADDQTEAVGADRLVSLGTELRRHVEGIPWTTEVKGGWIEAASVPTGK